MSTTLIEWAGRAWGYLQGCSPKSPGCSRCYARKIAQRLAKNPKVDQYTDEVAEWDGTMNFHLPGLMEPLLQKKGETWFPSMSDPFHHHDPEKNKGVPDEWIGLAVLVAALCPQHRFLMLTKRPERILDWLKSTVCQEVQQGLALRAFDELSLHLLANCDQADWWDFFRDATSRRDRSDAHSKFPLPNMFLGASVEDQIRAEERMPIMHQLKELGWPTFISAEPLIEEVNLHLDKYPVDWVIIGGESGYKSRPFNLNWGRSLLQQCRDNGVKAFFKQMGANAVDSVSYIVGTDFDSVHWQVEFKHKKGGDPEEWSREFQVRELPEILQIG